MTTVDEYIFPAVHFLIDDIAMPVPAQGGVTFSDEKVWSDDTGRLADDIEMVGTLLGIKRTVKLKWNLLSRKQVRALRGKISELVEWHKLTLVDVDGETVNLTVYFGNPTYEAYSWVCGMEYTQGFSVSAIEK